MYEGKEDHINDSFTKCLMILSFMWVNVSKSLIKFFLKTQLFVCLSQPEMHLVKVILITKEWDSLQQWENTMVSQTEIKALVSEQGWGLCRSSVTMYSARCGTLHVRLSVSASALLSHQNQCCHIPWGGDRSPRAQRKLPQQIIFLLRAHSCCLPCFCETHR